MRVIKLRRTRNSEGFRDGAGNLYPFDECSSAGSYSRALTDQESKGARRSERPSARHALVLTGVKQGKTSRA
jgi:hypothetical protein